MVPLPAWVDEDVLTAPILDFFAEYLPTVPRNAMVPEFPADREAAEDREAKHREVDLAAAIHPTEKAS